MRLWIYRNSPFFLPSHKEKYPVLFFLPFSKSLYLTWTGQPLPVSRYHPSVFRTRNSSLLCSFRLMEAQIYSNQTSTAAHASAYLAFSTVSICLINSLLVDGYRPPWSRLSLSCRSSRWLNIRFQKLHLFSPLDTSLQRQVEIRNSCISLMLTGGCHLVSFWPHIWTQWKSGSPYCVEFCTQPVPASLSDSSLKPMDLQILAGPEHYAKCLFLHLTYPSWLFQQPCSTTTP